MNVIALTYDQYMKNQSLLRTWLSKAVDKGDIQLAEVEYSIRDGERLPVVLLDVNMPIGLMVLELTDDAVHITALAGDFPAKWRSTIYDVCAGLAKEHGKDKLQCRGRRGWHRVLKEFNATGVDDTVTVEIV